MYGGYFADMTVPAMIQSCVTNIKIQIKLNSVHSAQTFNTLQTDVLWLVLCLS